MFGDCVCLSFTHRREMKHFEYISFFKNFNPIRFSQGSRMLLIIGYLKIVTRTAGRLGIFIILITIYLVGHKAYVNTEYMLTSKHEDYVDL